MGPSSVCPLLRYSCNCTIQEVVYIRSDVEFDVMRVGIVWGEEASSKFVESLPTNNTTFHQKYG